MEIRDIIHGSIGIDLFELPIVDSRYFQRLRQIKQLGFAENSFPSATHNRYIHSLGAMNVATQVWDTIFGRKNQLDTYHLPIAAFQRFRAIIRLASLLHDVGHGPLSHTTEFAMPDVKELRLPSQIPQRAKSRKATHEDYTLKIILDSDLTPLIEKAGQQFGFQPIHVAALIESKIELTDDFFSEWISSYSISKKVNFRPILQQIISSELDADRMDYLRRDSVHAGVSYGQFDFNWLVDNLTAYFEEGQCYLSLQHRALYAFEDFLISRFHMFLMVYFHHKSVIFDELLSQYFSSPDCDYALPSDIEKYCEYNDAHLSAHLAKSKNEWAQRIVEKRPYRMLIELHSGIPATRTARLEQQRLLAEIQDDLKKRGIHYLLSTSTSELSKYFRRPGNPLYVRYDNHYSTPDFIPLEQCTDLFQKYSDKRIISRLYVSPDQYALCRNLRRNEPLRYEDESSISN